MGSSNGNSQPSVNDSKPQDRRQWPRYPLRDAQGKLSWHEGSQTVSCDVVVSDISGGGAAVRADRAPAGVHDAELRLDSVTAGARPWSCVVVGAAQGPSGEMLIRLKFNHWIPLDTVLEKHRERRMWQRYPANEIATTLTWEENSKEVTIAGELANISGGGAALITNIHPPFNRGMWLELADRTRMIEPVESRLVVVSDDPSGVKIARLWFVCSCPLELFELARHGNATPQR